MIKKKKIFCLNKWILPHLILFDNYYFAFLLLYYYYFLHKFLKLFSRIYIPSDLFVKMDLWKKNLGQLIHMCARAYDVVQSDVLWCFNGQSFGDTHVSYKPVVTVYLFGFVRITTLGIVLFIEIALHELVSITKFSFYKMGWIC